MAVLKYFKYGLSCCNFRMLKDLESWNYSMANNCPHAYRKTWVCACVILIPSKTIGMGFTNLTYHYIGGKADHDDFNIIIGTVYIYIAVWSSIGFEIDYVMYSHMVPHRL